MRPRPERPNHAWARDFVEDRTRDGRRFRMLSVVDGSTRECSAIRAARKLGSAGVAGVLADLFTARGAPAHAHAHPDNGPEPFAEAVRGWMGGVGAEAAFIEPGSPRENGHVGGSNGKLRGEPLGAEAFNTPAGAKVLIERWRRRYNAGRPRSSLGRRPPSPEVFLARTAPLERSGPGGPAQPVTAVLH